MYIDRVVNNLLFLHSESNPLLVDKDSILVPVVKDMQQRGYVSYNEIVVNGVETLEVYPDVKIYKEKYGLSHYIEHMVNYPVMMAKELGVLRVEERDEFYQALCEASEEKELTVLRTVLNYKNAYMHFLLHGWVAKYGESPVYLRPTTKAHRQLGGHNSKTAAKKIRESFPTVYREVAEEE